MYKILSYLVVSWELCSSASEGSQVWAVYRKQLYACGVEDSSMETVWSFNDRPQCTQVLEYQFIQLL